MRLTFATDVEPDPNPACPSCGESTHVTQEQVLTSETAMSFWTCSACLRSWSAPRPRMLKADLKNRVRGENEG